MDLFYFYFFGERISPHLTFFFLFLNIKKVLGQFTTSFQQKCVCVSTSNMLKSLYLQMIAK
jgi:hypothetical protein